MKGVVLGSIERHWRALWARRTSGMLVSIECGRDDVIVCTVHKDAVRTEAKFHVVDLGVVVSVICNDGDKDFAAVPLCFERFRFGFRYGGLFREVQNRNKH